MTVAPAVDRAAPQDATAEQAVLGGMLLSPQAIADVVDILDAADFYKPAHAAVFNALTALAERGDPTDPIAVADRLNEAGDLARVGGIGYLHTLVESVPTAANAGYYARIVAERAGFRRLVEIGTRIVQLGYGNGEGYDLDAAAGLAQDAVLEATTRRAAGDLSVLADMLQPALDGIEAAGRPDSNTGIAAGFIDLDRLTNGFQPGQLIVVAGRPGLGKSTAALDFVRHAAIRGGHPAAVFSLEMSKVEIVTRLLSAEARVPLHLLRSGNLAEDDWVRMARRMGEIADAPLFVDDTANMTLPEIRAGALKLKAKHGLRLIVVDYLQLMSSPKKTESRQQEVSELCRGLKLLAKEAECPVVAVSQLNRGPEQRQDKRPLLSDLRESGSIEQDADIVILLHREDYYDKESPRAGEADFIVAKHRNGPTDTVTVAAQLHLSRFVDMAIA
jgi:replicative DNA helicase